MRSRIVLWEGELSPEEKRSRLMKLQRWLCRWDEGASCTSIDIWADNLFDRKGAESEWMCMIDTLKMAYPDEINIHTSLPDERGWIKDFFGHVGRNIYLYTHSETTEGELGSNVIFRTPITEGWEHDWVFIDGNQ